MKVQKQNSRKYFLGLIIGLFLFLVSGTMAQNYKVSDLTKDEYALKNLVASIHSEIRGIRESVICLVGKYRLFEAEDALIEQLKVERVPDTKILIALALFRLNSEKGMSEISDLMLNDADPQVKMMGQAIVKQY